MASLLFIVLLIKSGQLQDTHELTLHALSYHAFDEAALSSFVLIGKILPFKCTNHCNDPVSNNVYTMIT